MVKNAKPNLKQATTKATVDVVEYRIRNLPKLLVAIERTKWEEADKFKKRFFAALLKLWSAISKRIVWTIYVKSLSKATILNILSVNLKRMRVQYEKVKKVNERKVIAEIKKAMKAWNELWEKFKKVRTAEWIIRKVIDEYNDTSKWIKEWIYVNVSWYKEEILKLWAMLRTPVALNINIWDLLNKQMGIR